MRELEFLPPWYHVLRRRKRRLRLQTSLTLAVFSGFCLWNFQAARNVRNAEAALNSLRSQALQTENELGRLAYLEQLRVQWRQQDQIIARLGVSVESSRLIGTLESLMPPSMALLDFQIDTREQARPTEGLARVRASQADSTIPIDRTLVVRMHGVAPTDNDLASFHARLSEVPFFNNVAMTYARPRISKDYVMREFEITLSLNINAAGGR